MPVQVASEQPLAVTQRVRIGPAAGAPGPAASSVPAMRVYPDHGCDDLVPFPTVPELDQLRRLSDMVARL